MPPAEELPTNMVQKYFAQLLAVCLAISLALISNIQTPVNAAQQPLVMLRNCINTPNLPCVQSIKAIMPNGQQISAELTGRYATGEGASPRDKSDEYSLKGLKFEEPSEDKMINRVFYDGNWIQTVVEASWLNNYSGLDRSLSLPRRATNLYCGIKESPQKCNRNQLFNQSMQIIQELRLPKDFVLSFLNSRSDFLEFETGLNPKVIDGVEFVTTKLTFNVTKKQQVLFAPLLPDPLASSEYADFEIDQSIVNLYTPDSYDGRRLGKCSTTPSISVVSDGLNPATPEWDSADQTIKVSISGPHYKVNGDLNRGFFEAKISKALGMCLWGIDLSAKTQATISITDGAGVQEIQTLSAKMIGNIYSLKVSNFHYSNPIIKFRLSETQEIIPQKVEAATAPKKTTITCLKGKVTKKVTAVKPKCPAGYKKK